MPAINPEDFNNAKRDVDHIAALATSLALTAHDRFGQEKKTWTGIAADLGAAAAITETGQNRLGAAAERAGAAAERAGAATERVGAQTARTGAETARDAAQLSSGVFASTAAGLAATTNGKYFSIPSPDASIYLVLYRNDAGAATLIKSYPSIDGMFSYKATLAAGTSLNAATLQGIYFGAAGGNFLDLPAGYGNARNVILEVSDLTGINGRWKLQRLFRWDKLDEAWTRLVDTTPPNTGTSPWSRGQVPPDASIQSAMLVNDSVTNVKLPNTYSFVQALTIVNDLNGIIKSGIYISSTKPVNAPAAGTATGFLIVENTSNYILQTWRNFNDPSKAWIRQIRPGTSTYLDWTFIGPTGQPMLGQTLVSFGDSLTEFHNYPARIAARLGVTAYNVGFGGCRMAKHTDARYDSMSMYRLAESVASGDFSNLIAQAQLLYDQTVGTPAFDDNRANAALLASINFSAVDIVTIFYGTNDPYGTPPIPIGTNADSTGATFKGAINITIQKLMEKNPKMKIRFVTPTYRARQVPEDGKDSDHFPNSIGLYLKDYRDAIIEVCTAAHLPVIDAFTTSGINAYNITAMTFDGLHRLEPGIQRDADTIAAGILATC